MVARVGVPIGLSVQAKCEHDSNIHVPQSLDKVLIGLTAELMRFEWGHCHAN